MILLDQDEVRQLISMRETLDIVEEAYVEYSTGKAKVPLRYNLQLDKPDKFTLFMPGYVPSMGGLGLKVVSVFPENEKKGFPNTIGTIMLFDAETGVPTGILDGTFITSLRTGASSGVATKYLAPETAASLAIVGTGGMAAHQLEAVCSVRNIKDVYVCNRTEEKARRFVEEMKSGYRDDLNYHVVADPQQAVVQADIIVTSTTSSSPVVRYEWLRKGAHINAIGAFNDTMQEVDEETIRKSAVRAVDGISAASVAGDLAIPLRNNTIGSGDLAEIGTLIDGGYRRSSHARDAITYFKSVGLSVLDIAVAVKVLDKAAKRGIGKQSSM